MGAYLAALRVEREGCVLSGRSLRVAAIDVEIGRLGGVLPVVEVAAFAAPETAVVKRGPGRPRKEG